MKTSIGIVLIAVLLQACGGNSGVQKDASKASKMIEKQNIKLSTRLMTPEVLWYFGRLGSVQVAPNGKQIAYTISWYDIEQNKSNSEIYIMNADGSEKKQLTHSIERESALQWRPDGAYIAFLRNGVLTEIKPDGSGERKVQQAKEGLEISEFSYAPTSDKIIFAIETKVEKTLAKDLNPDMPLANAFTSNDLMYRHWDTWEDGSYSHLYIASYTDGSVGEPQDIMAGEAWDAPMKPFDGISETSWSPDGKLLAYSCKKLKGKAYAEATNANIYIYNVADKSTTMLTEGMFGYDKQPLFSPDGSKLLWLSMERAGFEADKERIFIYDLQTKTSSNYSDNFDASPSSIVWSADGKTLNFTACIAQTFRVFNLDIASKAISQISKDQDCDFQNVQCIDGGLIATRTQIVKPAEIVAIDVTTGLDQELSFINKDLLDQLDLPTVEKRMVKTSDNKEMFTWVILPPHFDKSKQHPAIMMCTGGPQGPVSQSYSYRWNYALMASNGYVVLYPARRGVSGSGQEWCDAVSKDHGGQPERDLLSAIDDLSKESWVDKNRLAAVGASYGGYSVYWLAGNHNKRFKAFVSHCGIFDLQAMYSTTEELFFENWEMGGPFWDKSNKQAQRVYAQSPINFVNNWDTPILVFHGGKDYRVPYTQGLAAYNVAQMKGIPSRLVLFPDENHWVTKPQNAIVWQREFFAWMDKYINNK